MGTTSVVELPKGHLQQGGRGEVKGQVQPHQLGGAVKAVGSPGHRL